MVVFPYGLFNRLSPEAVSQGVKDAYYDLTSTKYRTFLRIEQLKYTKHEGYTAEAVIPEPRVSTHSDVPELTEITWKPNIVKHEFWVVIRDHYALTPNLLNPSKDKWELTYSEEVGRYPQSEYSKQYLQNLIDESQSH